MTERYNESFEWTEVVDLFNIQENGEIEDQQRDRILERINSLTDRYGRDYVTRKLTLQSTH